ncbi:MAG: DUF2125 domain-containing protein [Alphaproteobacteria bacterium]
MAISIVTAIVIVVVGWWGLWSLAAAQYRHVIDGWIESGRASGYEISYADRQLSGFPHEIVLRFSNVKWKNTDNIIFHADDIDIAALPWRWDVFDASFKHRVQIDAPIDAEGHALILAGEDGHARIELDKDGFWRFSHISLANAQFGQSPNYVAKAGYLDATATRPDIPPQDHHEVGLTLTGEAHNVTLPTAMPTPFGLNMPRVDVDIRIMGVVPDFRKEESVQAWNNAMGIVEFDKLHMDWGPLKLTARGTMGFDDDLQPEGAFSGAIDNHEDVLKALMDHDFIAKRQEAMLNSALSLFAKPSKFSGAAGIEIPMTVQLGGLFLGPVRIFTFPEIEWPGRAPTPPALPDQSAAPVDGMPLETPAVAIPSTAPATAPAPLPDVIPVPSTVPMTPEAPAAP